MGVGVASNRFGPLCAIGRRGGEEEGRRGGEEERRRGGEEERR
jgi:hypothetical protein